MHGACLLIEVKVRKVENVAARGSLEKCREGACPAVGAGRCGRRAAVLPGFSAPLVLHLPDVELLPAALTLAWTGWGVRL